MNEVQVNSQGNVQPVDFTSQEPVQQQRSSQTEMMVTRQAQEVQVAMLAAKRFPRDQVVAYNNILRACQRRKLAENSMYEFPRGNEKITGPSIRLAEAIAQNWGNIDFGFMELEQRNGASQVMAYAWDLETNSRQTKLFSVPHIRHTRKGDYPLTDPRDIYEAVANQAARRVRACILGIIPSIAKTYGTMSDTAMMECINIYHQGSASALKRILAKTAKPYTADKIYATLREDLNDPVQNQVGDYESRQKAVIEMIHKYADEGAQKGETIMGVRMSNCGHDENGRYAGGKAGDQTGTEWYLRSWYAYSNGGWNYILRWKNEVLGNLFADLAIEAAQNDMIGYDQGTAGNSGDRYTFRQQMKAVGYRPSKITKPCECDCSEGTIVLIQAVGHLKGIKELQECNATYTGDMMNYFNSEKGKKYFTVLQGQYLKDSSLAKRGDINLNTGHHVNVTVDNGSNAGKGSATNTSTTKSTATLTNKIEVQLPVLKKGSKGVAVSMLQAMLNVNVDGDFGDDTKNALKVFQSNVKIAADGICGADTWKKVVEHMKTSTQ